MCSECNLWCLPHLHESQNWIDCVWSFWFIMSNTFFSMVVLGCPKRACHTFSFNSEIRTIHGLGDFNFGGLFVGTDDEEKSRLYRPFLSDPWSRIFPISLSLKRYQELEIYTIILLSLVIWDMLSKFLLICGTRRMLCSLSGVLE